MKTIFIGGSKTVGTICKSAHTFIKSYIQVGCLFLCGDCYGADTALQTFLLNEKYSNVVIYYVGEKPRNNIGQWQSVRVDTEQWLLPQACRTVRTSVPPPLPFVPLFEPP